MSKTGVESVVRLRPSSARPLHGARAEEVESTIANCTLIPAMSNEADYAASTVIVGYTLVAPPGTDLLPSDRIRARGVVWDIEGEPGDFRTRKGVHKAVMASLMRATG